MSNFRDYPSQFEPIIYSAKEAEKYIHENLDIAGLFLRKTLENWVHFIYESEPNLKLPYDTSIYSLMKEPEFIEILGNTTLINMMHGIRQLGNKTVHNTGKSKITEEQAIHTLQLLHTVSYYLMTLYSGDHVTKPVFDESLIPPSFSSQVVAQKETIKKLQEELQAKTELEKKKQAERIAKMIDEMVQQILIGLLQNKVIQLDLEKQDEIRALINNLNKALLSRNDIKDLLKKMINLENKAREKAQKLSDKANKMQAITPILETIFRTAPLFAALYAGGFWAYFKCFDRSKNDNAFSESTGMKAGVGVFGALFALSGPLAQAGSTRINNLKQDFNVFVEDFKKANMDISITLQLEVFNTIKNHFKASGSWNDEAGNAFEKTIFQYQPEEE